MPRPSVDVVVPFAGPASSLTRLLGRLDVLELRPGDTLTVVDNRRRPPRLPPATPTLITARERRGSYYARNAGATRGAAPWLLFIDADIEPPPDLLDRYFARAPDERAAILAGAVTDAPPACTGAPLAARYAALKQAMSQEQTLAHGEWAFAQTANCAVRRAAFEAVGGFNPDVRSAGDADLCFRLRDAGWTLERRPDAAVIHHGRQTIAGLLAQRARHGAGVAWLSRAHPGAFPRRRWAGLVVWSARRALTGVQALARGDRDTALTTLLDPLAVWAFELGRLLPNRARRARQRGGCTI